jgi:TRAP transporter TAXI family solute receptor
MKMKRLLVLSLVVGLVLCFGQSTSQTTAFAQDKINIAWGGSSPGGVMYYMVGVAGTIISRELPQYNITQVSTGGSTENTKRLLKGELDMGISYGAHVYLARKQEGPFKGFPKGDMLMGVTKAYAGPTYFITRPTTGIKKVADLKGKTVALGPPGSGTVFNCSNMLRAVGMLDKIKPRMMTFADAGRAMANNQIDAFCQSSAPAAAVKELAETKGAYILPFSDDEFGKIMKDYPFYTRVVMPKGTYKGVPDIDLPTLTVYWVAHERVPKQAVYDILKLVFEPKFRQELGDGYKTWKQMSPGVQSYLELGAQMHPGAEAYYKEKGWWDK